MTTRIASRPRKTLRKETALQVRAQLVLDVAGKATIVVLAGVSEKRLEVLAYEAVKNGLGRATREVRGSERGHEAIPCADPVRTMDLHAQHQGLRRTPAPTSR